MTFKQNAEADISIVCAPFVSDSGTYIDTDGVRHLNCAVNSALPTTLSVMKALIIKNFDEKSEDVHESSAIHKEINQEGRSVQAEPKRFVCKDFYRYLLKYLSVRFIKEFHYEKKNK